MSKGAELIRLASVIVLSGLMVGAVAYFAPQAARVSRGLPLTVPAILQKTPPPDSFAEHAFLKEQYEKSLAQEIEALIGRLVGSAAVHASVRADLNLRQAASPAKDGQLSQSREQVIRKLSVSVLVDGQMVAANAGEMFYQPRSKSEMNHYRTLIQSFVGLNPARGDTLEVLNIPFSEKNKWGSWAKSSIGQGCLFLILLGIYTLVFWRYVLPMLHALVCSDENRGGGAGSRAGPRNAVQTLFDRRPEQALALLKNWLYQPVPAKRKGRDFTPPQKAALVLLACGEGTIKAVLKQLNEMDMRRLSLLMAQMGKIPAAQVVRVLHEFLQAGRGNADVVGSRERVGAFLSEAFSAEKSAEIIADAALLNPHQPVWERLQKLELPLLARYLKAQPAANAALALYHFSPEKGAQALDLMDAAAAERILAELALLNERPARPDDAGRREKEMTTALQELLRQAGAKPGTEKVSEILQKIPRAKEQALLAGLTAKNPALARLVSFYRLKFDDIAGWADEEIGVLLKHITRKTAVLAVAGASEELREAWRRAMPPGVWERILKEAAHLREAELKETERARWTVVKTAQELIRCGKIRLS